MKNIYGAIILILCGFVAFGQKQAPRENAPKRTHFSFEKKAEINIGEAKNDFNPRLLIREMPKQGASKMVQYNYPEQSRSSSPKAAAPVLPTPVKGMSFVGNQFNVSTPCDNDIAISDSGFVVSVMNTSIYFRNIAALPGFLPAKSLAAFTSPVNNFHQEFDPKVIYDPDRDRFIIVCLVGNVDSTSKVIVGFSQTNKGNGLYNLYTLPGDALSNGLWSDYPMISLSKNELFLSLNLLYNDSSWQTGFVETIVWQINKDNGYNGQPISTNLHSNIHYNGKAIRNLCPVKGGSQLMGPDMYFLSNRNLASQNDTVFLVNISDTLGAAGASLTVKALTTSQPYYFPPDGRQTAVTQSLATNDSRNLGAFIENNIIQYVHNTMNPANNQVSVYYGVIDSVSAPNPTITGYIIPNDTMDFAYPNISYAGTSSADNTAIITFDHSSDKVFAGVSAIQADGAGNFSDVLRIQNGATSVNLLQSGLERWGDYSGSQRRYNKPGEVWMSGYYGYSHPSYPWAHAAWIAQITVTTTGGPITGTNEPEKNTLADLSVFPNPASSRLSVSFQIPSPEYLAFELFDVQGKKVATLLRDWVKTSDNLFSFDTKELDKGVYMLKIQGNRNTLITKKIIIE